MVVIQSPHVLRATFGLSSGPCAPTPSLLEPGNVANKGRKHRGVPSSSQADKCLLQHWHACGAAPISCSRKPMLAEEPSTIVAIFDYGRKPPAMTKLHIAKSERIVEPTNSPVHDDD